MNDWSYSVVVNNKNSRQATWGEQVVFHELASDNLHLLTAVAASVLNRLPDTPLSIEALRRIVREESSGPTLEDSHCEEFIQSLVSERLLQPQQL